MREFSHRPRIIYRIFNFIGYMKGYGHCKICRDSWWWKKYHVIPYKEGHGAFPYCEECHNTKNLQDKIFAMDTLLTHWMFDTPNLTNNYIDELVESYHLIQEAIKKGL